MLGFENAGGEHLEEFDKMKVFGRIVLCSMISQYNDTSRTDGQANMLLGTEAQTSTSHLQEKSTLQWREFW